LQERTTSYQKLCRVKTWKGPGRARSLSAGQWVNLNRLDFKLTGRQIDSWPCQVPFMLNIAFASKFDTYHLKYWLYYYTHWVRASKSDTTIKFVNKHTLNVAGFSKSKFLRTRQQGILLAEASIGWETSQIYICL